MDYVIKGGKEPKIGDAHGTPGKASPLLSSFIGNFTWSYIFIRHMICVFLGASCIIGLFSFCCVTIILVAHLLIETCTHREFARILIELRLYLLS